tara:strand:- start:55 stop:918 length:864 start_codon:yes stop_codon:yes gene_type:complete
MKLALGTAQFGLNYGMANKIGVVKNQDKILDFSLSQNLNFIDTAKSYGNSESNLGKLNLDFFNIVTKFYFSSNPKFKIDKFVNKELNDSLKKLNKKELYGFLVHDGKDLLSKKGEQIYKGLLLLKKNKLVKKIGVSVYETSELDDILSNFDIDLVQCPVSIFDNRFIRTGLIEKMFKKNIEIHARSIFLQGLLLTPIKNLPYKYKIFELNLKNWHEWLLSNKLSALEVCLRFVVENEFISKIVVGVDSLEQLKSIVKIYLTNKEINFPRFNFENNAKIIDPRTWKIL